MYRVVTTLICTVWVGRVFSSATSLEGPRFTDEPPGHVLFVNSKGQEVKCAASGTPVPSVRWVFQDGRPVVNIPHLVETSSDGNLRFYPFRKEEFRSEIHDTVYRCTAENIVGIVGSREVRVRAALRQEYETHVYDQYAIQGTTAVLRCHVPSSVREYVKVTSWVSDANKTIETLTKATLDPRKDQKYIVFPSGELHIHQVAPADGQRRYYCKSVYQLTGEEKISTAGGRIVLTDPQGGLPPKIINSKPKVWANKGDVVLLPCAAQGQPPPKYRWLKKEDKPLYGRRSRVQQIEGTLQINGIVPEDSGRYICIVNNSYGEDSSETEIIVTARLQVSMEPHQLVVLTGESATLTCSLTGYPIDSILWMKDLRHLTEDGRVQFLAPNVFHIPAVWKQDQGIYQCFVYSAGRTEQASTQVTVGDVGPVIHETFTERTVRPGTAVSLRCVSTGHPLPDITWFVDETILNERGGIAIGDFLTPQGKIVSYVNISHILSQDGGNFKCLARNNVGSVSHTARINVYGPPAIRPMNNISVIEGQTLVIHCPVTGYPLEPVSWVKGGLQLPENRRQKMFPNGTLIIYEVQRDYDQGQYKCSVRNSEGQADQKKVTVSVTTPPKIMPFDSPRVRAGTSVVITCAINQGDPPFDIRWMKSGQPLSPEVGLTVQMHEMFSILAFSGIRPHHAGNYTCQVTNAGGATSHSAALTVDVPPRWVVEPRNASVILGQSLTLDCKADGLPPPTVSWKKAQGKDPRDFESVYNSYNYVVYGNGSLTIRDADSGSEGYYLCQANNNVGASLTKLVQVTVHTPPHFDTQHQVKTTKLGASLELLCEAKGDAPLEVTWNKDGAPISDQAEDRYLVTQGNKDNSIHSVLLVKQAERNDSGLFSCRVGNAYGVSEATYQVVVQESPSSPSGIQIKEKSGRSLTVSWEEPFSGHSAITGYVIQYSLKKEGHWFNTSVPASKTAAVIQSLIPANMYIVRIQAENAVGRSNFSSSLSVSTEEEDPGGPPLNVRVFPTGPNSIKVTWEMPKRELWNGKLKGYYIGYKVIGSNEPAMFKTSEITKGRDLEVHLTNLRRSTKYGVSVQAFNGKGAGPRSDEVVVQTLADVPPTAPVLNLLSTTSTSITLNWTHKRTFGSPVTECVLYFRKEYGEWQEETVNSQSTSHTVTSLECGSRYHFYMVCHNSVGRSEPSDILTARTAGAAPLSPSKEDFIVSESNSAVLQLDSWQNGGCPIGKFNVKLRKKYHPTWTTIAGNIALTQSRHTIPDLGPGTWYELQVTAHSSAGATEAQYEFQTKNITEESKTPQRSETETSLPFYLDFTIVIPVVTSAVIVVIIVIVGCVLCHKRTSQRSTCGSDGSGSSHKSRQAMEIMAMKDINGSGQPGNLSSDEGTQRSSSSTHSRPLSSLVQTAGKHDPCYLQCPLKMTKAIPTLPPMTPYPTTDSWGNQVLPGFGR